MANKKVLVVTKDIGGYNVVRKPAELLKATGHEVVVVAEGLSLGRWYKDGGFQVFGGIPEEGNIDPKSLIRRDLDPGKVLDEVEPDVVVATMGSPINLEESICFQANARNIPVVIVEDIWGCHKRAQQVIPKLICTLDAVGAELARGHYHLADGMPKLVETGSPAFDKFAAGAIPPNRPLLSMVEGFDKVVYILGQDESTTPYLEGVLKAVREKNGSNGNLSSLLS